MRTSSDGVTSNRNNNRVLGVAIVIFVILLGSLTVGLLYGTNFFKSSKNKQQIQSRPQSTKAKESKKYVKHNNDIPENQISDPEELYDLTDQNTEEILPQDFDSQKPVGGKSSNTQRSQQKSLPKSGRTQQAPQTSTSSNQPVPAKSTTARNPEKTPPKTASSQPLEAGSKSPVTGDKSPPKKGNPKSPKRGPKVPPAGGKPPLQHGSHSVGQHGKPPPPVTSEHFKSVVKTIEMTDSSGKKYLYIPFYLPKDIWHQKLSSARLGNYWQDGKDQIQIQWHGSLLKCWNGEACFQAARFQDPTIRQNIAAIVDADTARTQAQTMQKSQSQM